MASKVWTNISGTSSHDFTVGKNGPTIYQGENLPQANVGKTADLYIRIGTNAGVYQKEISGWRSTTSLFVRQEVSQGGSSSQINDTTTYVAIVPSSVTTITSIVLPAGHTGRTVTIKNESGPGDILVGGQIDGQNGYLIENDNGSVTVLWAGSSWVVIRES